MRNNGRIRLGAICLAAAMLLTGGALSEAPEEWTVTAEEAAPAAEAAPQEETAPAADSYSAAVEDGGDSASGGQASWTLQGDVLLACSSTAASLSVPSGVREIAPQAFMNLTTLEEITLPDSVEIIGAEAFAGCVNLRRVRVSPNTRLSAIGNRAFMNCAKLATNFVTSWAWLGEDVFLGVPGGGESEPEPAATPQPEEPTESPEEPFYGGGGWGGGPSQPHAKNTVPAAPEYDLVALPGQEAQEPMLQLELGTEALPLWLEQAGDRGFTAVTRTWKADAAEGETNSAEGEAKAADTLLLRAEDGESTAVWRFGGDLLRRLHRSGIRHLALQRGDRLAALSTEGVLAGWKLDALRSAGTASRRFIFEITMTAEGEEQGMLQVEGESYPLSTDPHAAIYLTEIWTGDAEAPLMPLPTSNTQEDRP